MAFYYPWFPSAWTQHGITPYTHFHPASGAYASSDAAVVRAQVAEMQYAHLDAGIISWWGQGSTEDRTVPTDLADGKLDLVTLMFNYHDLGFLKVDRDAMNKAVFKALKSGGQYVIADHSGRSGTGISESGTLHRIEEAFLRKEVEAAGFKLIAEGNFLRNPNDPRDKNTPDPPMPKDEFVLKFAKP